MRRPVMRRDTNGWEARGVTRGYRRGLARREEGTRMIGGEGRDNTGRGEDASLGRDRLRVELVTAATEE